MSVPPGLDLQSTVSSNRLLGLWRMMSGYRLRYAGASLSLGVAAFSRTAQSLLVRYFVDQILTPARYERLPLAAAGFIFLALFEGTFTFLSGRLAAQTAEGVTRRLRDYLFDHIQRLPFAYHAETSTGELIQRSTSDVDAIRRFFADQAINIGRIILLFVINLAALINLNATLALVSIAVVPFILLTSLFFFRKISAAYEHYQEQEATLSTTLQENLTGVRVVKAFARQDFERDKFEKDNWEKFLRGKRLLRMHALFWPASDILCGFQMLAGFLTGAILAINGTITVGTYLAYAGLVVWIIFPLRNLGRLIIQMSTGLVSYHRVSEILKQTRETLETGDFLPQGSLRGEISFQNVSFAYSDGKPVLEDITFTCHPGQVIALLGSTGSGKTSLMNLLPRFYDYTAGCITLDGVELTRYPRRYLRQQIGIVEQEPFLFSRSIRENITYGVGREVPQAEVEAAAALRGDPRCHLVLPGGLCDHRRGEGGHPLRRSKTAGGDSPHPAERPAHPDPG